jgi:anti-sigma-K factor RskA
MSEIHALSGAYAVDALDDLERARFERHLAECAECRAEVASLRETAALLAEETATPPSAALRDRVLTGISTIRPLPPEVPVREARSGARRWLPALVAAAVLAVVGIGAVVWQPWTADETSVTPTATEQVLQAPDAAEETLSFPGGASATLVRSETEGRAVLVTESMPPAPAGSVYQLWLNMPGQGMVSAGVMPPEEDQTVLLEGDAATATAAGITVEPAGGSTAPTSDPIALFDFAELEQNA